jgi:uncharacterized protein YjbI with pentapeptide repeats
MIPYTLFLSNTRRFNDILTYGTPIEILNLSTDDASELLDIGFDFYLNSVMYTKFSVNTNGLLIFNQETPYKYVKLTDIVNNVPILVPLYFNMESSVRYIKLKNKTIIQWDNIIGIPDKILNPQHTRGKIQIILYNYIYKIEFKYQNINFMNKSKNQDLYTNIGIIYNISDIEISEHFMPINMNNITLHFYANNYNIDLSDKDLSTFDLTSINLMDMNIINYDLTDVIIDDGIKINTRLNVYNDNLQHPCTLLNKRAKLSNKDLTGVNFSRADLKNADISNCILINTKMIGADLSNVDLSKSIIMNSDLSDISLINANLSNTYLNNINLMNANMLDAHLSHTNIVNSNLTNANLSGTELNNSNISNTIIRGTNFTNANLSFVNFIGKDLTDVIFTNANITGTKFDTSINIINYNGKLDNIIIHNGDSLFDALEIIPQPGIYGGSIKFIIDNIEINMNEPIIDKNNPYKIFVVLMNDKPNINGVYLVLNIIPKTYLTIQGLIAKKKIYDGSTNISINGKANLVGLNKKYNNVTLCPDLVKSNFYDKNIGNNKKINISGYYLTGSDINKYTLIQPSYITATIDKFNVTIEGININSKIYDGSVNATPQLYGTPQLNFICGTDCINIGGTPNAIYNDKNIGRKEVYVTGYRIYGSDSQNYLLSNPSCTLIGEITKATITIKAVVTNKIYDNIISASPILDMNGIIKGDDVQISYASALYDDVLPGSRKVTISGIYIYGQDASNYDLDINTLIVDTLIINTLIINTTILEATDKNIKDKQEIDVYIPPKIYNKNIDTLNDKIIKQLDDSITCITIEADDKIPYSFNANISKDRQIIIDSNIMICANHDNMMIGNILTYIYHKRNSIMKNSYGYLDIYCKIFDSNYNQIISKENPLLIQLMINDSFLLYNYINSEPHLLIKGVDYMTHSDTLNHQIIEVYNDTFYSIDIPYIIDPINITQSPTNIRLINYEQPKYSLAHDIAVIENNLIRPKRIGTTNITINNIYNNVSNIIESTIAIIPTLSKMYKKNGKIYDPSNPSYIVNETYNNYLYGLNKNGAKLGYVLLQNIIFNNGMLTCDIKFNNLINVIHNVGYCYSLNITNPTIKDNIINATISNNHVITSFNKICCNEYYIRSFVITNQSIFYSNVVII